MIGVQWWSYWGDVVEGLFSWEAAWPALGGFGGKSPGDISPDLPVINGAVAHNKGYMIGMHSSLSIIHTKLTTCSFERVAVQE